MSDYVKKGVCLLLIATFSISNQYSKALIKSTDVHMKVGESHRKKKVSSISQLKKINKNIKEIQKTLLG